MLAGRPIENGRSSIPSELVWEKGVGMTDYRYKAFISYSWADAKWGKWLHHTTETYRTPRQLIGKLTENGEVPARLHPLFKDREEEAAGSSIGAAVEATLADSEFLIVICSPTSAKSKWVNHEIAWFKANRNPTKILALIVDGEPGSETQECFPKALTHRVDESGKITNSFIDAPLAADARDSGDGKRMARLKIAAAMLGVGLDELVNREERRRTVRTRVITTASLALAAVMSTLTWFAVEARKEAEFQRNEADGLVEFMLTDLREKLEPVGRLDALDVVGDRALDYYAAQKLGNLDADALGRRSRALLLVGEISNIRGNSEEALKAFTQAAATTKEQLARDPDNEQRIFDHAQSVFWVGAIAYGRGELEDAEAQFQEYKRLADRLIELDPSNPDWQMESSYAEVNLGVMFREQRRHDEAEPSFSNALSRVELVAKKEDYDSGRQTEIGQILNWLAQTKDAIGKYRESLSAHQREVKIYEEVLEADGANTEAKNRLSIALQFVGDQQLNLGNIEDAIASYRRSLAGNSELRSLEPDNTEWQETAVRALHVHAELLMYAGQEDASGIELLKAKKLLDRMTAKDPENEIWSQELRLSELALLTQRDLARNNLANAAENSARIATLIDETSGGAARTRAAVVYQLRGDIYFRQGRPKTAQEMWEKALMVLPENETSAVRYLLLKRLGQTEDALKVAKELDRRGYRHPAYMSER